MLHTSDSKRKIQGSYALPRGLWRGKLAELRVAPIICITECEAQPLDRFAHLNRSRPDFQSAASCTACK